MYKLFIQDKRFLFLELPLILAKTDISYIDDKDLKNLSI